jgi:DNA-binding transcriptional MerR regulator
VRVAVIKGEGQSAGARDDVARRGGTQRANARRASTTVSPAEEQGLLFDDEPEAGREDVGYRGPTACTAAGITYRQLDYWARTGLVEPSVRPAKGSGSQRLYGFRDILTLKIVKRLLDTGISLQQIRTAVDFLREQGADDVAGVTLMSDGASVYACTSTDEVVDLLQGGQGVFGIALGRVWQEVEGTLADLPAERAEGQPPAGDGAASSALGPDELARRRARRTG